MRRVVFDLVGPAARAMRPVPRIALSDADRLTRSLSLMMRTEILPVTCRIAPEFVSHLIAQSLLGNRRGLEANVPGAQPAPAANAEPWLAESAPTVSPLHALALARFEWSRVAGQIQVDRVGLLTRHLYPFSRANEIVLRDATDIVLNDIGVALAAPDAVAVRLEQGVVDTNAETLVLMKAHVFGNAADALTAGGDWVTLAARADTSLRESHLSPDVRHRITSQSRGCIRRRRAEGAGGDDAGSVRRLVADQSGHGPCPGGQRQRLGDVLAERSVKHNAASYSGAVLKEMGKKAAKQFATAFGTQLLFCTFMVEGQGIVSGPGFIKATASVPRECVGDALFRGISRDAAADLPDPASAVRAARPRRRLETACHQYEVRRAPQAKRAARPALSGRTAFGRTASGGILSVAAERALSVRSNRRIRFAMGTCRAASREVRAP